MENKRIVVKVGTSTLCHGGRGLNFRSIERIARALSDARNEGFELTLVSSGAIGAGVGKLNLPERPRELRMKQAVAAVGQLELMHIYDKLFSEYGVTVGQILLTKDDIERGGARANVLGTFGALFALGAIPIVNENDAVSTQEIENERNVLGDNDTLSAIVAEFIGAEKLVILSDIDGLFDANPRVNADARLIPFVDEITPEIEKIAGGVGSALGTGGMATKVQAARIATAAGCEVVICNGALTENIHRAIHGMPCGTVFRAL